MIGSAWARLAPIGLLLSASALSGTGFDYQTRCGTVSTTTTLTRPGVLLIGGAEADQPGEIEATEWFIDQGGNGDYLVLRTDGIGSQAQWVCDTFGEVVSSASELSIDRRSAADLPQVISLIESAEMIFIAGGDQSEYRDRWRSTALAEALNRFMLTRPIAGTSAGMAILGASYYAPEASSLHGSEILDDPFHPNSAGIAHGDFLHHPALRWSVTDTHLNRAHGPDDEFRYARLFGLLARLRASHPSAPTWTAIGAEEATLIAIDDHRVARVFGTGRAYFLVANPAGPEQILAGNPLIWDQSAMAARVYRIEGRTTGNGPVPLRNWPQASGGAWFDWFTSGGLDGFNAATGSCTACQAADPPPWFQPLFADRFQR